MLTNETLIDAFDRINTVVQAAVDGLTDSQLAYRPDEAANSIVWLVWHLTRVQDDHIADVAGIEQAWTNGGWNGRFDLPFDDTATGYGHNSAEVGKVQASADLLLDYHSAVHVQTTEYLSKLAAADYEKIVDTNWDPPVTLAMRLVSVISDNLQHAGQAAYVRGLLK